MSQGIYVTRTHICRLVTMVYVTKMRWDFWTAMGRIRVLVCMHVDCRRMAQSIAHIVLVLSSIVDGCRNRTRDVGNKFHMGISCICHNVCVTMHALAHMASFYQLKWIYTYMCPTSMFYTGWICHICTLMGWIGMHVNCWWLALSPTHVKMRCHMWFHMWYNVYLQCICHKVYVTMYMSQ